MAVLLETSLGSSGLYGESYVGVLITPTADWLIDSIWLKDVATSSAGNVTCYIYLDSAEAPSGSALATSDAVACAIDPGGPETFTFSTPYQMTFGNLYWFLLHQPGQTTTFDYWGAQPDTSIHTGYSTHANDPVNNWGITSNANPSEMKVNGTLPVGLTSGRRGFTTRSSVLLHRR
jgi:hypothetical protein